MNLNIFSSFKKRVSKRNFKNKIKQENRKIFIDSFSDKDKIFKKRTKITFNIPNFNTLFSREWLIRVFSFLWISFLLIFFSFIFSPYFYLKTINIDRDDNEKDFIDLNISYNSVSSYRNKNIIFLDKSNISEQIINYQKNIYRVDINKQFFPPKLDIKLWSYKPSFYTEFNWKKYVVMENGVFIPANVSLMKDLKEIKLSLSRSSLEFIDYKILIKESYLKKIVSLKKLLVNNIPWVKISKIYYFEKEREVHFDINDNVKLIFDINAEGDEQMKKLVVFNKEHIDLTKTNSVYYIDLRIANKIFYCEKADSSYCSENLKILYNLYG